MKIDFEHYLGNEIGNKILESIETEAVLTLVSKTGAMLCKDGNQWCYIVGEMPVDYLAGFGNTPNEAALDFSKNFYTQPTNPLTPH